MHFFEIKQIMNANQRETLRFIKYFRNLLVAAISTVIIYFAFAVYAGILSPGAPPVSTMKSLDKIYSVIAGTYDASLVGASSEGNIFQELKCMTKKMNNEGC